MKAGGATKIKICGITRVEDAREAVRLGADVLGFNFYAPSPRYVRAEQAAAIIAGMERRVKHVGVFVNAKTEEIEAVLKGCPLEGAQLHGSESPQQCREVAALGVEVIKAVRMRSAGDMEQLQAYEVETVLLDAFREDLYGGTGETFDWGWIKDTGGKKVFLAGGIGPENVREALAVGVYGLDICSGVEAEPGVKDGGKMRELFERVRGYYDH